MFKKILLGIIVIMSLGLLLGCQKTMKIIEFDGLKDLSNNPTRIVFGTNSMNFDEETELYGDPIEYELIKANFVEIVELLFNISYKAYPEEVVIDPSPIIRYLIFYNEEGDTWTVYLGLKRHNDHYYYPVNDADFTSFLYSSIMTNIIPFNEGYLGGQCVDLDVVYMQAVVRSRQELITFFDGHDFVWIDNTPIWERYNNEFFETKAILLYIEVTASASVSYILEDVQMINGAVTLHIVGQYYGDTWDNVEGFASFVIEVNKSDINNITAYETKVKYEQLGD